MLQRSEDAHARLLAEIAAEKVAALRRISARLEELLAELDGLQTVINERRGERGPLVARFNGVREQARLFRWFLEVQREALGLLRHDGLDEFYKVPAPMRD